MIEPTSLEKRSFAGQLQYHFFGLNSANRENSSIEKFKTWFFEDWNFNQRYTVINCEKYWIRKENMLCWVQQMNTLQVVDKFLFLEIFLIEFFERERERKECNFLLDFCVVRYSMKHFLHVSQFVFYEKIFFLLSFQLSK